MRSFAHKQAPMPLIALTPCRRGPRGFGRVPLEIAVQRPLALRYSKFV